MNVLTPKRERGFTIIELLIATTVFSVIVLVATSGIIRIGQLYYKGVTISKTQERARVLSEEISRAVQFSNENVTFEPNPAPWDGIVCFSDSRYFYKLDTPYKAGTAVNINTAQGLVAQRLGNNQDCGTCPRTSAVGGCVKEVVQLLGDNMRLLDFGVANIGVSDAWAIELGIAYGDGDLLTEHDQSGNLNGALENSTCRGNISGSSFCATAHLDTIVKRRIN